MADRLVGALSRGTILTIAVCMLVLPAFTGPAPVLYDTLVVIAIFSVMAYGLDLVVSDLGEVSLAHPVFWAAGAYITGVLATRHGWSGWTTLALAILGAAAIAAIIGVLTVRTREFIFSLATYSATVVAVSVAANSSLLGASDGIAGIPTLELSIAGLKLAPVTNAELWPYAFVLLCVALLVVRRFRRSQLGAVAVMTSMNPELAASLGHNQRRARVQVLMLSAGITGAAGWLYAYQRSFVSPDLLSPYFLVLMLTAVVITGKRVLLGPLIGTSLILVQQNHASVGADGDAVILGAVLAFTLIAWPRGLIGAWESVTRRRPMARTGPEGPSAPEASEHTDVLTTSRQQL